MTKSNTGPDKANDSRNEAGNAQSETAPDTPTSRTQSGPENAVSLEARREALRNAERGDQFVVATDLEDSEQREAAPGVREQD